MKRSEMIRLMISEVVDVRKFDSRIEDTVESLLDVIEKAGMMPPEDKPTKEYDHCDCGYINTNSITWDKE